MDDIVKQAMAKWPNVPHCYGWLGLDARGNWYMRDDKVQALGSFTQARGVLLKHEKLIAFIHRNYASEDNSQSPAAGCWYFQNGPQRVYVELEATPWIWRVQSDFSVIAHTGDAARIQRCVADEHGRLYLDTDIGFGLVHTADMLLAAEAVEQGLWVPQSMLTQDLPQRFAYVRSPKKANADMVQQQL